ncbi:MAG: amino acid--tRNA ligase-related protein [Candidatus Paceibacterota bacterium]|jgi:aspartyl-tRNA synthetase
MERTYIKDLKGKIGSEVKIAGWVDIRRDHGKLIFIDLRDVTGKVQMVILPARNASQGSACVAGGPNHKEAHALAQKVRPEWVIEVTGKINNRPEKLVNKNEPNGEIEVEVLELNVLNEAETPPFDISSDGKEINEETRLKYRYLDLRRPRLQKNIRIRSEFVDRVRQYLFSKGFTEIETPYFTSTTPEGSRDFVVPSRMYPGKFFALPQSPQQYKQLLMAAGFERYFQIARCFRDEDLRADRGFEHTQIDLEVSFTTREELMQLDEEMITIVSEAMGHKIKEKPFPRFSYKKAIEKFGADKFDLRNEEEKKNGVLAFAWVIDFPFFEKDKEGKWTFTHNPFSMPAPEHLEWHLKGENIDKIITQQYDLVCNGYETGGGSIRAHKPDILRATFKTMGYSDAQIEKDFGHMLKAFSYGTPSHGGIAHGIERMIMIFTGEKELREVQSFPQTSSGHTAVMDAPNELSKEQLKELGIKLA